MERRPRGRGAVREDPGGEARRGEIARLDAAVIARAFEQLVAEQPQPRTAERALDEVASGGGFETRDLRGELLRASEHQYARVLRGGDQRDRQHRGERGSRQRRGDHPGHEPQEEQPLTQVHHVQCHEGQRPVSGHDRTTP